MRARVTAGWELSMTSAMLGSMPSDFARERSEVAHDKFKKDLSYDDYRSRLKLAVSDTQRREATEENGLMIRRKLEELNATFAAFKKKAGESD